MSASIAPAPRSSRGRTSRAAEGDAQDVSMTDGMLVGGHPSKKLESGHVVAARDDGGSKTIMPAYFGAQKKRDPKPSTNGSKDSANLQRKETQSNQTEDSSSASIAKSTEIRAAKNKKGSDKAGPDLAAYFAQKKATNCSVNSANSQRKETKSNKNEDANSASIGKSTESRAAKSKKGSDKAETDMQAHSPQKKPTSCSVDSSSLPRKEPQSSKTDDVDSASLKSPEQILVKGKKGPDKDDVGQGAQLLLGFAQANCEDSPADAAGAAQPRANDVDQRDEAGANSGDGERNEKPGEAVAGGAPVDEDWAWEPSCHEGLLTFHDGRKRWYHCMYCQYFNDRLYHSKMHFERIHVKQGKSMPRKRKYMDPAGTKAGEAAALPPSTQKQPEPKYSRTRRPGDKWLKTVADPGSHAGFRYQSVHDRKPCPSRSCSPTSPHEPEVKSDDEHIIASEIQRRAAMLSPSSLQLTCWETDAAIRRGADKGDFVKAWKPVYTFKADIGPASVSDSHRSERDKAAALADPIMPPAVKRWKWWWYDAVGSVPNTEESGFDAQGNDADVLQSAEGNGDLAAANVASTILRAGEAGMAFVPVVKAEYIGTAEQFHISAMQSAASVLGNGVFVGTNQRLMNEMGCLPPPVNGFAVVPPGCLIRPAARGRGMGAESAAGRAKRVWRRWDPTEENALREAVDHLGTKDWAAIHERMRTDRSIKQLQDHWNDTKKERVPVAVAGK